MGHNPAEQIAEVFPGVDLGGAAPFDQAFAVHLPLVRNCVHHGVKPLECYIDMLRPITPGRSVLRTSERRSLMKRYVMQLAVAAGLAVLSVETGLAAERARDYVVKCGQVGLIVSDRGYLRAVDVQGKRVVESVGLLATCGDRSVKGRGRVSQSCTYWENSHDVAPRGVQIERDAENGRVVVTREGILAFDRKEDAKVLAYTQRTEISVEGTIALAYELEFLQALNWSYRPVSIAMHIPMSLAEGATCALDQRPPRMIAATWDKKTQVTGSFRALDLAGLRVSVDEGAVGGLSDPRSWESSRRSNHQYVSIAKSRPWFDGLQPIEKGTKWRIACTIQLPGISSAPEAVVHVSLPPPPERPWGRVLFEDSFERDELGPDWTGGAFAKSATDKHTKDLTASGDRGAAAIRDNALDLRVAGGRGKCTAQARINTIPARCVLQFDLNLKHDDTIGKTQHSLFFRSLSEAGECLCLHVDTRRQFFFFEVKHKGRWVGERLYYYPFAFTAPPRDQRFRFTIESAGDSGALIWITGEDIPANNMPIALLGGKEWTPFEDGELFFFSSNREPDAIAHAQWDNIRVSDLPPRPTLNELYYRDQLLVGFREYLYAPPGAAVEVALRSAPDGKALIEGSVGPLDWKNSRLLLDTSMLRPGDYVVTADLVDRDGKRLYRSTVDFHKVRDPKIKLADMTVHVDGENRLIVDGKPFFPISMYCCVPSHAKRWEPDALFAEMAAAGFNTVQSYSVVGSNEQRAIETRVIPWLDMAHKHGLSVYLGVATSGYPVFRRRGRSRNLSDPFGARIDPFADTARNVRLLRDHPAVLCWYIGDESIGHGMAEGYMSRLNRLVKGLDPHHPTCIATCPGGHRNDGLRRTARVCDIPANDHYPTKDVGDAWRSTALKSQDAVDGLQTWWAVPLCCKRPFDDNELRVQVYEAIVHGARGVIWWAAVYTKTRFPENWTKVKALASELRDLSPILLGDTCPDDVRIEPETAAVDCILRLAQGRRYLIVVNSKPEPSPAITFTVPGATSCRPLFGDAAPLDVRDGRFTHRLEANARNVYKLN